MVAMLRDIQTPIPTVCPGCALPFDTDAEMIEHWIKSGAWNKKQDRIDPKAPHQDPRFKAAQDTEITTIIKKEVKAIPATSAFRPSFVGAKAEVPDYIIRFRHCYLLGHTVLVGSGIVLLGCFMVPSVTTWLPVAGLLALLRLPAVRRRTSEIASTVWPFRAVHMAAKWLATKTAPAHAFFDEVLDELDEAGLPWWFCLVNSAFLVFAGAMVGALSATVLLLPARALISAIEWISRYPVALLPAMGILALVAFFRRAALRWAIEALTWLGMSLALVGSVAIITAVLRGR